MNWYWELNGEQIGPVSFSELKKLAVAGSITRTSHVKDAIDANWVEAANVPELFPSSEAHVLNDAPRRDKSGGARFMCRIDGKELGPLTAGQLKKLADSGNLKSSDRIQRVGTKEWRTASRFRNLFSGSKNEKRGGKQQGKSQSWQPVAAQMPEVAVGIGKGFPIASWRIQEDHQRK